MMNEDQQVGGPGLQQFNTVKVTALIIHHLRRKKVYRNIFDLMFLREVSYAQKQLFMLYLFIYFCENCEIFDSICFKYEFKCLYYHIKFTFIPLL